MKHTVKRADQPGRGQVGTERSVAFAAFDEGLDAAQRPVVVGADPLAGEFTMGDHQQGAVLVDVPPGRVHQPGKGLAWIPG